MGGSKATFLRLSLVDESETRAIGCLAKAPLPDAFLFPR